MKTTAALTFMRTPPEGASGWRSNYCHYLTNCIGLLVSEYFTLMGLAAGVKVCLVLVALPLLGRFFRDSVARRLRLHRLSAGITTT